MHTHIVDIIVEDGLPYVTLHTNITIRPAKLLIDTGASVTVVASDMFKRGVVNTKKTISGGGLDPDAEIRTLGVATAALSFTGHVKLNLKMHVLDRKFTQYCDGILGFETINKYKLVFYMPTKKLVYCSNNKFNIIDFVFGR